MNLSELKATCPVCKSENTYSFEGTYAQKILGHSLSRSCNECHAIWNENRRADAKAERLLEAAKRVVLTMEPDHIADLARAVEDFEK